MGNFVKVALVSEFPINTAKVVNVDGRPIALFNSGGIFYAINNSCPHRGGPLGNGFLTENIVTCPVHGWSFDITNGESKFRDSNAIACFEVKVEGDELLINSQPRSTEFRDEKN